MTVGPSSRSANPQSGTSIITLPECLYEDPPAHANAHASSSAHPQPSAPGHAHPLQPRADDTSALESRVQQLEDMLRMVAQGQQPTQPVLPSLGNQPIPHAPSSQWRMPDASMAPHPPQQQQPLQTFPPSVPAPLSVPQSTFEGATPYAFPWGAPHVAFPHPVLTAGQAPSQPSPPPTAPSWPFPASAPPPLRPHRQSTGGSPSSFLGQATPQMSSSSEGTIPTPSSNEGFFPSPAADQPRGDNSLTGSPEQEAILKGLMEGATAVAEDAETIAAGDGADDEEWLLVRCHQGLTSCFPLNDR